MELPLWNHLHKHAAKTGKPSHSSYITLRLGNVNSEMVETVPILTLDLALQDSGWRSRPRTFQLGLNLAVHAASRLE
jgi:hypothetical protein